MEGLLLLRSALEGARRAVRSAADAINGALLGTEEEALMNRDPIMEVVAQNPREALRFIKLVMLFGASTGVLVSVPCIVYLSFYWGNCRCNKPLQWWVLIFSVLQISQVPVRYLFFFHLHTTPDDRTRIINTARILTGGRGWKCSKFVSILSYAWFILGVVWVFNAYDCSEAPGLWKLTVAAIVVSVLRLVTTFVCFWMSFPPNAAGGQPPEAFRGAATAEQIARLPLYTYAEKKKHLTGLLAATDVIAAAGKGDSRGPSALREPSAVQQAVKGRHRLSTDECHLRSLPFEEPPPPREDSADATGAAAAARPAPKHAARVEHDGSEVKCLSSTVIAPITVSGINKEDTKGGREAHRRQAASEEPRRKGDGKRECNGEAATLGRCNRSRRRTKSDCSSRVTRSAFGVFGSAEETELVSGSTGTKHGETYSSSRVQSLDKHQENQFLAREAPHQERSDILSSRSCDSHVSGTRVVHGSDHNERNVALGLRRWSSLSVSPSLPESVSGSCGEYAVSPGAVEQIRVGVEGKEKDGEPVNRADAAVTRVEEQTGWEAVTLYAAAPTAGNTAPADTTAADTTAWTGLRAVPQQYGGAKGGGELSSVQENCCICLSEFQDLEIVRELYCTHFFHQPCIDKWLLKNKQCPLCLRNIDADEIEVDRLAQHS